MGFFEKMKFEVPIENSDWKENIVLYLHDFACMFTVVLILFLFAFRIIVVSGGSMRATLRDGDYLLLLSNVFYQEPAYGDIVVISKESFEGGKPIVKRVIATEGQTVDIDFQEGIVYVDGSPLSESYVNTPTNLQEGVRFPLTVEKGCVFVMGDNRNDSRDSRYPAIGQVDCREVLGKAIVLLFPGTDENTVPRDLERIRVLN